MQTCAVQNILGMHSVESQLEVLAFKVVIEETLLVKLDQQAMSEPLLTLMSKKSNILKDRVICVHHPAVLDPAIEPRKRLIEVVIEGSRESYHYF